MIVQYFSQCKCLPAPVHGKKKGGTAFAEKDSFAFYMYNSILRQSTSYLFPLLNNKCSCKFNVFRSALVLTYMNKE